MNLTSGTGGNGTDDGSPQTTKDPFSPFNAASMIAVSSYWSVAAFVAAGLILGEQYRSTRNQTKRRDAVDDQLDELKSSVESLNSRVDALARQQEERFTEESMRYVSPLPHTVSRPHQTVDMLTWALQT